MSNNNQLPYTIHRSVLQPILQSICQGLATKDINFALDLQENEAVELIMDQGLFGHWYQLLDIVITDPAKNKFYQLLKQRLMAEIAVYLLQLKTLYTLHKLFDANGIRYAVFKGAHLREELYEPPAIRSVQDIDVLISAEQRAKVVKLLSQKGFSCYRRLANIGVEASFSDKHSTIDLHWSVFRAERSRIDLVEPFLTDRLYRNNFYCLSAEHALFVMLVHPVFTKYLTSPIMFLSRIVDIYAWIEKKDIKWQSLFDLLDRAHLKTAAWLTATYCELLSDIAFPRDFMAAVKPGKAKASYLNYWVRNNLSSRFFTTPMIPKLFFTFPAHDGVGDVCSFLASMLQHKKDAKMILDELDEIVRKNGGDRS